ncbi:hypothetical protein STRATTON_193 [Erwinia phage vB_EamM_Stratton]|uniref:Uncharacterized protein n=1 Tax=Erwinia phage vB_EamM_Stratton TaxID=1883378 RepID=A0A1B2IH80_9CAUD|nr:hypothetical protein STRATTON_193 [Erwinia phage vB_EamM_Stratton]
MSLFAVVTEHLKRQENEDALTAIKNAAGGKLNGVLDNRRRIRAYMVGEDDTFYSDLSNRVVSCAVLVIPDGTFDQFENGKHYGELMNDYSTLNLRIDDAIIIVAC